MEGAGAKILRSNFADGRSRIETVRLGFLFRGFNIFVVWLSNAKSAKIG